MVRHAAGGADRGHLVRSGTQDRRGEEERDKQANEPVAKADFLLKLFVREEVEGKVGTLLELL